MNRFVRPAIATLVTVTALGVAPTARAGGSSVTLSASAPTVRYGDAVTLSGAIDPPAGGEPVDIVSGTGDVLATPVTHGEGFFSAHLSPDSNVAVHAEWNGASSVPVDLRVRFAVIGHLRNVRLFDAARLLGWVAPATAGAQVTIELFRSGHVVGTKQAPMDASGAFSASFRISRPGVYRARAAFDDADHVPGSDLTEPRDTPLPFLHEGSHGRSVLLLERRLVALRYRVSRVNRSYDFRTADAVMAFTKVQRLPRSQSVGPAVWRRLAGPRRPRARQRGAGLHLEVNQSLQVLLTVDDGKVTNIIHVSTGANGATHDGSYHVYRKLAGTSGGGLYYPSYFDGLRAIHGWTEVPSYPASHGCVRVPYWQARWIFGLARFGTRVLVYH